ncbi:DUF1876 domain-containing protein [Amorphoplanes nipponensis]|uniref:DUF1876 domain-containing protein n=1 Tax=Actinoplanes nipponensis TaxID=135950 RepID=A0A919JRJ6_9ACTN|nr:dsRBD fold-containing protein [Actinoplanes nipponensis]GIE54137.1 hypothetical protein Ani05nite_76710 [Actinoplanes nipponensis]
MAGARTWTVEITITEHEDERRTHAAAVLRGVRPYLRGEGEAYRRPSDREVPEVGDELAAARALADLASKALDVATGDVEQFSHRHARLLA